MFKNLNAQIIIVLVVVIASFLAVAYYFLLQPKSTLDIVKVTSPESAEKGISNIKSNIGEAQKELTNAQNVLPT